jgi:hypothetical protein
MQRKSKEGILFTTKSKTRISLSGIRRGFNGSYNWILDAGKDKN